MMIKPTLYTLFLLFILTSCDREPAAIDYGTTSCHSCKMTIVDQQHAAQVMTKKGRTYSFDAIECMVRSLDQWQPEELQILLVTDYTTPKQLIEAQSAHYLISKAIPSPMGAHLSAFSKKENRDELASNPTDQKLAWSELKFSIN